MNKFLKKAPSDFGNIEKLSSIFYAFENFPATQIVPFTKEDVLVAIKNNQFDSRPFQSAEVNQEFQQLLDKLSKEGKSNSEKDELLKIHARNYHIARTAYLVNNISQEPIIVTIDNQVKDGIHRIMAAIVRNEKEISCVVE
jgi:hypothetical protein